MWALVIALGISVVLAICFAAIIWALPRGFDWSDEAWVYSLIESNRITIGEPWGYQHVLHPIFILLGDSVLNFRILRFLGYVVIGIGASFAFLRLAQSRKWHLSKIQKVILFTGAQFGTVIAFSYPPRYVSYNELASWLTQLFVILTIFIFSLRWRKGKNFLPSKSEKWLWSGIGLVLAISFGARITTFAVLAFVTVLLLAIWSTSLRSTAKQVLSVIVGLVVGALALLAAGFPFSNYVTNLLYVFTDPQARIDYDHPISELLSIYWGSVQTSFSIVWPILLIVTFIFSATLFQSQRFKPNKSVIWILCGLSIIVSGQILISIPRTNNWLLLGTILFAIAIVLMLEMLLILRLQTINHFGTESSNLSLFEKIQFIFLAAVILFVPIGAAVGTNNAITGQMIFSATAWVTYSIGFAIVISNFYEKTGSRASTIGLQVIFGVFAIIATYGLFFDLTKVPYRTPLYSLQNTETKANYVSGLLLTSEQSNWADWVSEKAKTLRAEYTPTVSINAPGALLVFNNSPLASPWIAGFWPVSAKSIAVGCKQFEVPPDDFIVIQDGNVGVVDSWEQDVQKQLESCGLIFPEDFEIAAQRNSPVSNGQTTIWRLKQ